MSHSDNPIYSPSYQRGWNRAYCGLSLCAGGTPNDDMRQGFQDFLKADMKERVPFMTSVESGVPDVQAMQDMLIKCMNQFEMYAKSHHAKNTPEATEKALVNEAFVREIKEILK